MGAVRFVNFAINFREKETASGARRLRGETMLSKESLHG